MFLSSYTNTSGSLVEREMPQTSVSTAFSSSPNFYECFYDLIETRRKYFSFLLENSPRKIMKNKEHLIALFIIKMYVLYTTQFTHQIMGGYQNINYAIIFVFLSSYRNRIINRSARIFSLSYFLNKIIIGPMEHPSCFCC